MTDDEPITEDGRTTDDESMTDEESMTDVDQAAEGPAPAVSGRALDFDLAIIGAGAMGEALLKGIISGGALKPHQIVVTDVREDRLEELRQTYGVDVTSDNLEAIDWADVVLIAVKPQQLEDLFEGLRRRLRPDHLLVSIAAGVTTARLRELAAVDLPVIRVMPNSPALVGRAVSAVSAAADVDEEAVSVAMQLLSSVGEVVRVDESVQNAVTAVSGSGPAYFYLLVEQLAAAGEELGLSPEESLRLVVETMAGSAAMLEQTGRGPEELRRMVTSPGGTTEAALKVFERRHFDTMVEQAVKAAAKKAEELSGGGE